MKDIVELIAKLEDRVLAQENYKDAVYEAEIFLDKYCTIDNEGYLQYRARYVLSRFKDIKAEEYAHNST